MGTRNIMNEDWKKDIAGFDPYQWDMLRIQLDKVTYNRFSVFFKNQVLKCCELYELFMPLISHNMNFLKENDDTIVGGSLISRQGEKGSVDSVSYETKGADNILRANVKDPRHNPLVSIPLMSLMDKFYLRSNVMGIKNFMCGACPKEVGCGSPNNGDCGCSKGFAQYGDRFV